MKPFGIIPPHVDLVNKAGFVAREWWRWFNAIQEVTDGGQSGSLGDAVIQSQVEPPHGNDYDAAIANATKLLQAPSPHGTDHDTAIADLRKRLEALPRGGDARVALKVDDLRAMILALPRADTSSKALDPLVALRSVARSDWNAGYVAGLGGNLTLSGGVLNAAAGGVTSITAGDGLSGGTITTSGTMQADQQASQTVVGSTATVTPASGQSSVAVTLQASTTLTIANGIYSGQHLRLKLIQDSTGSRTVAFDSTVKFGTELTTFTASIAANAIDLVQLIWDNTNSRWMFAAVVHGY